MTNAERIASILADPAASNWLKRSLESACKRDPVDATNDAEFLGELLADRAQEILAGKRQTEYPESTGHDVSLN